MNAPKWKIFVINLDRSPERLDFMRAQFSALGMDFERLNALDGKLVPEAELEKHYDPKLNARTFVRSLHSGQIAVYMSHKLAWQKILDENLDFALVLEDDVKVLDNLQEVVKFLEQRFPDWSFMRIQRGKKPRRVLGREKVGGFEVLELFKILGEMFGYALTAESARVLLEKRKTFGRPVDIDLQYHWETGVEVRDLRPWCVELSDYGAQSDLNSCNQRKIPAHYPAVRQVLILRYSARQLLWLLKKYGFFGGLAKMLRCAFARREVV